jgi:hypothetical protein
MWPISARHAGDGMSGGDLKEGLIMETQMLIPIEKLRPSPLNPRKTVDQEAPADYKSMAANDRDDG